MMRLYTDGACSKNGSKDAVGGWAFVIVNDKDEIVKQGAGAEVGATNNQMEYTAMLMGLREAEKLHDAYIVDSFECYTDSALLYNTLTQWIHGWHDNGWKRKTGEIKNLGLVRQLYPFALCKWVNFNHVNGHVGEKWNEWCDKEAVAARLALEADNENYSC